MKKLLSVVMLLFCATFMSPEPPDYMIEINIRGIRESITQINIPYHDDQIIPYQLGTIGTRMPRFSSGTLTRCPSEAESLSSVSDDEVWQHVEEDEEQSPVVGNQTDGNLRQIDAEIIRFRQIFFRIYDLFYSWILAGKISVESDHRQRKFIRVHPHRLESHELSIILELVSPRHISNL